MTTRPKPGRRRQRSRSAAPAPDPPPAAPALPVRIARWAAAIVGFTATLLGVVFLLWPSLKPEGPAATKAVTLSNLTVDHPISFGQYLDRKESSRAPYEAADLGRRGVFLEFDYTIQGYKNKLLPLRWQLVDARSGEQLDQSRDVLIKPLAATDQGSWDVWVRVPAGRADRYYVALQLFNDAGAVPIGRLRTERFAGT